MSKIVPFLLVGCLCAPAAGQRSSAPSEAEGVLPSDVHSGLFAPPSSERKSTETARLTAGLPVEAGGEVVRKNFIDDYLFGKMSRDGVPHAPPASDREFIRRVKLDLAGRLPTPEEIREFLADEAPDKRARLIDGLVGSPEFVDKWAYFLMDLLRLQGKASGYKLFHYWLKQNLAGDRPYNELAGDIISASGKSNNVVAALNPIAREHVEGKPGQVSSGDDLRKVHQLDTHDELTIQFGKVFLGVNLSCVSCHDGANHLEKVNVYLAGKTRADFFQQAAFLGRTRYIPHVERTEAIMAHFIIDDEAPGYDAAGDSMLRMPRGGGPDEPRFLLTGETPRPAADPREELARILTADPQFARATVNLFWSKLMGIGIVEPYDEFDLARLDPENLPEGWDAQPSHPELLNELAEYFRKNDYSLHKLFSLICESSAYQLSARFPGEWSDAYARYYARKFTRMLTAEEVHDAIVVASGVPGEFNDAGEVVPMAMQVSLSKPKGELKSFLQAFGQSNRNTAARPPVPSPLQPIMLMRSPVVTERLTAERGRVEQLAASGRSDSEIVEELFLASIGREPLPVERDLALTALAKDRRRGAENLLWALLNSAEFLHNF